MTRLLGLGATNADVGQGSDRDRAVMADAEGNECDVPLVCQQNGLSAKDEFPVGDAEFRPGSGYGPLWIRDAHRCGRPECSLRSCRRTWWSAIAASSADAVSDISR